MGGGGTIYIYIYIYIYVYVCRRLCKHIGVEVTMSMIKSERDTKAGST